MSYKQISERGTLATYDFYVRFKGKRYRHRISCPRSAVRDVYRKWESEVFSGAVIGRRKLFETIDEYWTWVQNNKSEVLIESEEFYIRLIKEFFGDKELSEIKRPDVIDLRVWRLAQGVKPATTNRLLSTLSFFYNWCIEREYANFNPVFKAKLRETNERTVRFSPEQMAEIFEKANPHQMQWLMIAIHTGLRMGEILSLKWNRVDLVSGIIHLEAMNTKSKKSRQIPISDELGNYLKAHRSENISSEYVVTYRGKPINRVTRSWNNLRDQLSFSKEIGLRFHDQRHVFGTTLLITGTPVTTVQGYLGHSDLKTTMKYLHPADDLARERVNAISEYRRKPSQNPVKDVQHLSNGGNDPKNGETESKN